MTNRTIQGGIFVEDFYELTQGKTCENTSFPPLAILPLVQGNHNAGRWAVQTGDEVQEEQVLTHGTSDGGVPLHAPVPGYVEAIKDIQLPGGQECSAVFLRFQGAFARTGKKSESRAWESLSPAELLKRIHDKGVLVSPTPLDSLKALPQVKTIDTLVVNSMEPEPYVTLGLNLLEEFAPRVQEAVKILQKIYGPGKLIFTADQKTLGPIQTLSQNFAQVQVKNLPNKYPLALKPILVRVLQLEESRSLILDIPSLLALWEAVVLEKPCIERYVLVSGDSARHPGIYRVRLGMPIAQFLEDAGGFSSPPEKIVLGGPFRGYTIEDLSSPITKDTSAILVFSKRVVNHARPAPCIRCGECIDVCPVGIQPVSLFKSIKAGAWEEAREEGLEDCIECGLCGFTCPSRIPLLEAFKSAKAAHEKEAVHG